MISKTDLFNYLYYTSLPSLYRDRDDGTLKKYLEALVDGGYDFLIQGEIGFTDLVNPDRCPENLLPTLAECHGLEYYPTIPSKYYRKMLNNIVELNRRRGTTNCVRYLCRVLTGMEVDLSYTSTPSVKTLHIDLKAVTLNDVSNIDLSIKVVGMFIMNFIPYYITNVIITSVVNTKVITNTTYRRNLISLSKRIHFPRNYEI